MIQRHVISELTKRNRQFKGQDVLLERNLEDAILNLYSLPFYTNNEDGMFVYISESYKLNEHKKGTAACSL